MGYDYWTAKEKIESGEPYSLESVATTWRNFAEALRTAAGHLQGTADKVTAQYGEPYQNFGDRAIPVAGWMSNVSGYATAVAEGLSKASTTGSQAQMTMYEESYAFNAAVDKIVGPEDALSVGRAQAIQRREEQAAQVLNAELTKWTAAYNAFQPGALDSAPTRAGSGSADNGGAGGSGGTGGSGGAQPLSNDTNGNGNGNGNGSGAAAAIVGVGTVGAGTTTTGNGTQVGNGQFPGSSVVGPGDGDFAGWVKDPRTGYLIDPTTGQEFDPTTGRWIDPVTGKPFGDVEQYANRLEGLEGGNPATGLLGGAPGLSPVLAGGGGGGGGLTGLYGGLQPPSLAPGNPAALQLQQQAADKMAAKAYAAEQLALKEASQGGRPFVPPMQGGLAGGPDSGRGANRRRSLITEPESTWTNRGLARTLGRGGGGGGGGRGFGAAEEPPLGAGSSAAARANAARGRAGRLPGEPMEPVAGRAGAAGQSGGRGSYLPPTQAGGADERAGKRRKRPDWLVEDDVWSSGQQAGPPVLGED
ncbi:hypothetical protein Dvina_38485 [Dactylosporangium vinaceum]|uniref:PPE family domain-containing protein n=1 Tax=Dactylosporangium vinaceum TaxID=53362 RepID=A0ABV5ML47_9ACTN|nr:MULTISPECIES: hypothetical protein [Dactylosporangium]UAB94037.1 hypothetical protein Dvina_38485 [Dactylosporangium vinaceum]UWZ42445.1 hypothetical protein Dmats_33440 [Dactylosporangium matsuzakiense]